MYMKIKYRDTALTLKLTIRSHENHLKYSITVPTIHLTYDCRDEKGGDDDNKLYEAEKKCNK